jgi:myo-inositol 2-dehydrogenase/D-chiro-inositol 1-dehydrogenase
MRVGILGAGEMGHAYAEILRSHTKGMRLVAIAGGTRAPDLAARFGVRTASPGDLIGDPHVDAIVIATPPASHTGYALQALVAGKHVHLEKPMAVRTADCDRLIAKAEAVGSVLSVSSVMRYRGTVAASRKAIEEGRIGKVLMMRATFEWVRYDFSDKPWHLDPANGSPALNVVSHVHDVIRHLAGDAVEAMSIATSFAGRPHGRSAISQFVLDSGALADAWTTYELPPPGLGSSCKYLVVGSEGMLDVDAYGQARLGRGEAWEILYEQPPFRYRDLVADADDLFGPVRLRAFADQLQDFQRSVVDHEPLPFTARDARAGVAMVEAAERSAREGRRVRLQSTT